MGLWSIVALGLNVMTGYAGQLNLGIGVYMGTGAYTAAMLTTGAGLDPWLALPCAVAASALMGFLTGLPALRVREDSLAVFTIGLVFVFESLLIYLPYFGGPVGIGRIPAMAINGAALGKENYLVLVLGVLLLDDRALSWIGLTPPQPVAGSTTRESGWVSEGGAVQSASRSRLYQRIETGILGVAFYTTIVAFLMGGSDSILALPSRLLAPFRIANAYGLFAVMTPARYEIEFQGSNDGTNWTAYPFRYKPQNPYERPGFYAPYQPRFDWNLWFASLASWQANPWVVLTEERLLEGSPAVLGLFRRDPFNGKPPAMVRTILWQYWFTDLATKRKTGAWWRRQELGPFSPAARQ